MIEEYDTYLKNKIKLKPLLPLRKSTFFSIRIHSFHLCTNLFLTLIILVRRFTRLLVHFVVTVTTGTCHKNKHKQTILKWKWIF